jgi:two-component system sensor histidine kinase CreC
MTPEQRSPGRAVLFVHNLISALAPPLHSLRWKIFLLCLAAVFLPGVYFAWKVGQGIERSHLRSTEQGMIDTGLVLAETWEAAPLTNLPHARETFQKVFKDSSPNLRAVFYDVSGRVLHDTGGILPDGSDQSASRDVRAAMRGEYGSRWERDPYRRVVILYSTIPVWKHGRIAGIIGIVKTTADVRKSVIKSLKDLAVPTLLALALAALVSYALSTYLTRIITGLARRAERVADGEPGVRLETWTKSELGDLSRALEKMRRKLEGKAYIEEMALTLSHEIKTPLASIRGAAEILGQAEDPAVRSKFVGNILGEVDRLASIVTNLLALSRIEAAPADSAARSSLDEIARQVASVFRSRATSLGLVFETRISARPCWVGIPADQLTRLMEALLENAFQFTPRGGRVLFETDPPRLRVSDEGPGIPEELRGKVFDRFFTTVNPLTGRRGTGLGLAFVKSIAARYNARISLESSPGSGTTVSVRFAEIAAG